MEKSEPSHSEQDVDLEKKLEQKPDFEEFIPLDTDISSEEALQWLYKYYPDTRKGFFEEEFSDLASSAGTVRFEKSKLARHGGNIKLSGESSDGKYWYCILGKKNGIKQVKIG